MPIAGERPESLGRIPSAAIRNRLTAGGSDLSPMRRGDLWLPVPAPFALCLRASSASCSTGGNDDLLNGTISSASLSDTIPASSAARTLGLACVPMRALRRIVRALVPVDFAV